MAWQMNEVLDQLEAFFREVDTAFTCASQGHYYRKTQPEGLHGYFYDSLVRLNNSLEALESNTKFISRNELLSRVNELNSYSLLKNLKGNQSDMLQVTEQMSSVLDIAQENAASMLQNAGELSAIADESKGEIGRFAQQFQRISDSADQTLHKVNYAQAINFASLVKVDHLVYKQNGYMVIHTGIDSEEANAVLVDHHNCRFGGWYYQGDGLELYSDTRAYREIEGPHSEVHRATNQAVQLLNADWQNDEPIKQQITDAFQQAEEASDQVMHLVDQMVHERFA